MNTKLSPAWIFRFLIFATLLLGLALRFTVPITAARLLHNPHRHLGNHSRELIDGTIEIAKGLGEALFVAAILAAIVDPYVKFRLGTEVGREIARETVGQHLPEELRQALESIQDIDLYQLHLVIDVTLEKVDSLPEFLKWQTAMHYEVRNAAWNKRVFEHRVSISDSAAERADGRIIAVSHSVDGSVQYSLKEPSPELARMCKRENEVTSFKHPSSRKIASTRLGATHKYEYFNTTERLVPHSEVQVIQLVFPTVGIELTVRHPEKIIINTSVQYIDGIAPETPDGETPGRVSHWKSERAYLNNEHIWIIYENDEEAAPAASAG